MDVKDVQIDSRIPAITTKEEITSDSSGAVTAKPEFSILVAQDKIDVSDETVQRSLNADISSRNHTLEKHNKSLTSLNVVDDQATKITTLLRSVAGIASQAVTASSGQVDKLQQELNNLLAEIQNVGSTLRSTVNTSTTLDGSVKDSVTGALSNIAPEPPSQPPKLVLLNKAGVLATQHAVAKSQAQFAALRESISKATEGFKELTSSLRSPVDQDTQVKTPEEAFKLTTTVVKDALDNPTTAIQVGALSDARITL